jgi:hypothetical protein
MEWKPKMKLAYIAGPYRAASEYEVHCNIQRAEKAAVRAWRSGYAAICPHKNSAYLGGAVLDETILEGDLEMLRRCDVLILCGEYQKSAGAMAELREAKQCGMPICDYDAGRDRIVMRSNAETRKHQHAETVGAGVGYAEVDMPQGKYDIDPGRKAESGKQKTQKKKPGVCIHCGGPHGGDPHDWIMADDSLVCAGCFSTQRVGTRFSGMV